MRRYPIAPKSKRDAANGNRVDDHTVINGDIRNNGLTTVVEIRRIGDGDVISDYRHVNLPVLALATTAALHANRYKPNRKGCQHLYRFGAEIISIRSRKPQFRFRRRMLRLIPNGFPKPMQRKERMRGTRHRR